MRVLVACEESQAVTIAFVPWGTRRTRATLSHAVGGTRNGTCSKTLHPCYRKSGT